METLELPSDSEIYKGHCPTREIIGRIADKWTLLIMGLLLASESRRFNELRRAIGGISQKMLTQTLRNLERDGLVDRKIYAEIPPRVEYAVTELGKTLCGPMTALTQWAQQHIDEVRAAQEAFDAKSSP
jgi:DNA-binding HxlR family transcriptional regulator